MTKQQMSSTNNLMTMQELMDLPSLKGCIVIAGKAGLHNSVTNAMIIEGPDVEKWGSPSLVLLTSFYALEPLSEEERDLFFVKLHELGISGIIYKPGRMKSAAIAHYLEMCNYYKLPVIQMDPKITFAQVLMDIMGKAIDSNFSLLNTYYTVHQQTIKLAIEQPSIHVVISRLKDQLGHHISYYSRSENVHIGTSPHKAHFNSMHLEEITYLQYQSFHYYKAELYRDHEEPEQALAVLTAQQTTGSSYLIVHEQPELVSEFERMIIENYTSLLLTELLKQEAIDQKVFSRNNMIVHDLLHNRYTSRDEIDHALSELSIDSHQLYQAMLLRISITDANRSGQAHEIFATFSRRIKQLYGRAVFFESNNRIVFLRNYTSSSNGFNRNAIDAVLIDMHKNPDLPPFVHLLAFSNGTDRYSIESINNQVMGIYKLFDSDHLANRNISYDDLGIYKFLIETGDISRFESYLDPRLRLLRNESPEGFKTLTLLCECNCDFNEAAKCMFVHPKTIHYRINRIKKIYGLDARDSNDLVQILLASKLDILLGSATPE